MEHGSQQSWQITNRISTGCCGSGQTIATKILGAVVFSISGASGYALATLAQLDRIG
jgi:hypothetical protein